MVLFVRVNWKYDIVIIASIFAMTSTASGALSPIWPIYIVKLGATMTELGLVFTASNITAAILQVPSGLLSDRFGRKKLHVLGSLLGILPPFMYISAINWIDLLPWAFLAGISTGLSSSIRWTVVADASPDKMASAYGWTITGMLGGMTLGPFLGGFISDLYGMKATFLVSFLLYIITSLLAIMMRETGSSRLDLSPIPSKNHTSLFRVLVVFSIVNIVQGIGFGLLPPLLPVFITTRFRVDFTRLGIIYALGTGLPAMIVQLPGGKIAERFDKKKLIILTLLLSSPFNAILPLSWNLIVLLLSLFLGGAIMNIAWPAYQSLMMELTPRERRGFMNGISATTMWIGMSVGSAISGLIWEGLGSAFPFYLTTILFLVSSIPFAFLDGYAPPSNATSSKITLGFQNFLLKPKILQGFSTINLGIRSFIPNSSILVEIYQRCSKDLWASPLLIHLNRNCQHLER
ncbi:MAG: MFS transporter [Thermoproteota archaeon]